MRGYLNRVAVIILILLYGVNLVQAQQVTQNIPEKTRLLFLLDGSASMYGEWERTLKIRVARSILSKLVDSLKIDPNVELALRIYGHNSPPEDRNCEDTKLEVPFSQSNHDQIIETIRNLEPKGTTPIPRRRRHEQAPHKFPMIVVHVAPRPNFRQERFLRGGSPVE